MIGGLRRTLGCAGVMTCVVIAAGGVADAARPTPRVSARAADFLAAKHQWVAAQTLSGGAAQAVPFILVDGDLRRAIRAGANRAADTREIALIVRFGALPDAMLTPAQEREFTTDFTSIDRFFGLTKNAWAGGCLSGGPDARAAVLAWEREPIGSKDGIDAAPLMAAAADLARGLTADRGDRSCYPAAIADLENLESATAAEVAASGTFTASAFSDPGPVATVGAEILWLNDWFGFEDSSVGNVNRLAPPNAF